MLDIASYSLPASVSPRAVLIVTALAFAAGYQIWSRGASSVKPGGVPPVFINKPAPKRGARRIIEMVAMLVLAVGAIALATATGPRLYDALDGHLLRIGDNNSLFTLGLFGSGVALAFFGVREFYRLLRI